MTSSDTRGSSGYRHVFTWAQGGSLGKPGFQTIVVDDELEERGLRPRVERVVAGFRAARFVEGTLVCQVVPLEGVRNATLLTTFTALGAVGDHRQGNFLADSIMVHNGWLEEAGWDSYAAFQTLNWPGLRWLDDPANTLRRVASLDLPPLPLESLSLNRLASLQTIPKATFIPLVAALAQGEQDWVFLREMAGSPPELLNRLVRLLPLCLPPRLRRRVREGKTEIFSLRTRGGLGAEPPVCLQGVPAEVATSPSVGTVFDLSGGYPRHGASERALAYARWLWQRVTEEDWDLIRYHYEQTTAKPNQDPLEELPAAGPARPADPSEAPSLQPLPGLPQAPPVQPERASAPAQQRAKATVGEPVVLQRRRDVWQQRRILEYEGWKVAQDLEQQMQTLIDTLRTQLEQSQGQALELMTGLQGEIQQRLDEEKKWAQEHQKEVAKLFQQQSKELREERNRLFGQIKKEARETHEQERKALTSLLNNIERVFSEDRRLRRENHDEAIALLVGDPPREVATTEPRLPLKKRERHEEPEGRESSAARDEDLKGTGPRGRDAAKKPSMGQQVIKPKQGRRLWNRFPDLLGKPIVFVPLAAILSIALGFLAIVAYEAIRDRNSEPWKAEEAKKREKINNERSLLARNALEECAKLGTEGSSIQASDLDDQGKALKTKCDNFLLAYQLQSQVTSNGAALTQAVLKLHKESLDLPENNTCVEDLSISNKFGEDSRVLLAKLLTGCKSQSSPVDDRQAVESYLRDRFQFEVTLSEPTGDGQFDLTVGSPIFGEKGDNNEQDNLLIPLRLAAETAADFALFADWEDISDRKKLIAGYSNVLSPQDRAWIEYVIANLPEGVPSKEKLQKRLEDLKKQEEELAG